MLLGAMWLNSIGLLYDPLPAIMFVTLCLYPYVPTDPRVVVIYLS